MLNLVRNIVTGDETWIYCHDLKTNTVWVYQDESKPTKVGRERSVSNRMTAFLIKPGTWLRCFVKLSYPEPVAARGRREWAQRRRRPRANTKSVNLRPIRLLLSSVFTAGL
ncbi:hypothetical protein EVAR_59190_1 [Eumeta japonica]|uniref:Mariner Mos1 transposase n=1 Tax=Eumeta variegata TaxID=151549 RepID=A0A4C1ZB57_EUMVA|nr:hypothetical protein EVAR_59190_1 [Eumeta japonica]